MKNEILNIFENISSRWFLTEPLLFSVYCTHQFVPNTKLKVPFRTGKMRIEYSEKILRELNEEMIEELLKIEVLRILLKHPYQRQPEFAKKKVLTQASNITINYVYEINSNAKSFLNGLEYKLPSGLCFEEYYSLVYEILNNSKPNSNCNSSIVPSDISGESDDEEDEDKEQEQSRDNPHKDSENGKTNKDFKINLNKSTENEKEKKSYKADKLAADNSKSQTEVLEEQVSELWEDDESICCDINNLIEIAENTDSWGTIPEQLQNIIKASKKIQMDYRRMLSIFRTSVLSSKRKLTRMKPNRRFGFENMGNRYELATNLLIAVDVSGSVSDKNISNFLSIINRFFKYGIQKLDVIQFDSELKSDKPLPMKKARSCIKIIGRGGTAFQPVADFFCNHSEYDGLIYFTDGYAPPPIFNTKRPIDILWVLTGNQEFDKHSAWIKQLKRNRVTYIPRQE